MPVAVSYPGVYIEEVASGVRTITGVATSIAAFVDNFARGPLNEALLLLSYADFEREFGGLNATSEASYGIKQFFLNGGAQAYAVRVGLGTVAQPFAAANAVLAGAAVNLLQVTAGREVRGQSVDDPGAWGNQVRIDIDYDTRVPNESIDPLRVQTNAELFNVTITEMDRRGGRNVVVRTESYPTVTLRPGARNNAISVINPQSKIVQLAEIAVLAAGDRPFASGTLGAVLAAVYPAPASGDVCTITVDPDGSGAAVVNANVNLVHDGSPTNYAQLRPFLEQALRSAAPPTGAIRDLLLNATVELVDERDANNLVTGQRYRVRLSRTAPGFDPAATANFAGALATALGLDTATVSGQQLALANGGDGALAGSVEIRGSRAARTGIYALEDIGLFNILCLPAAAQLAPADMRAAYGEAEAYCEERRAFLIIDPDASADDLAGMQQWLTDNEALRHRNASVYFPHLRVADPLDQNRLRNFGSSGTMAGLFAATDTARGVWKAPAGLDVRLRGVDGLTVELTDRENGALNPLGVNCHRRFPVHGMVSWGARTLDGADQQGSEWKYIPVRRLALFLEESLFRGTQWVVFEPNDEPLWAQIRLNIGAYMHSLFRQGAFQGRTPREAYFVKCDRETTTQDDINRGVVNIAVGFAPLKPAEFVIIQIQQMAGQIQS